MQPFQKFLIRDSRLESSDAKIAFGELAKLSPSRTPGTAMLHKPPSLWPPRLPNHNGVCSLGEGGGGRGGRGDRGEWGGGRGREGGRSYRLLEKVRAGECDNEHTKTGKVARAVLKREHQQTKQVGNGGGGRGGGTWLVLTQHTPHSKTAVAHDCCRHLNNSTGRQLLHMTAADTRTNNRKTAGGHDWGRHGTQHHRKTAVGHD